MPLLCLVVGAACTSDEPLTQLQVLGGTDAQRAEASAELYDFDRWIGTSRLALSGVEFKERAKFESNLLGSYDRMTDRISLSPSLRPDAVRETLRHELCHALDADERLLASPIAAFDLVVTAIGEDESHGLHDALGGSQRTGRAELFAYLCMHGPLGAALFANSCAAPDMQYAAPGAWIMQEVWTGEPDVSDAEWGLRPAIGPLLLPFDVGELRALGSESASSFQLLALGFGEEAQHMTLGVEDGTPTEPFSDLAGGAVEAGCEVAQPVGAPSLFCDTSGVSAPADAVSDGVMALQVLHEHQIMGYEIDAHVLASRVGGPWSLISGVCPGDVTTVFSAGEGVYLAWAQDRQVWWARAN